MKSFAIVNFFEDETVAVVPTNWIVIYGDKIKCCYPTMVESKLKKAVKKSKDVDPSWPVYECRILKEYDDYAAAANDIPRSTYESELSETGHSKKRRLEHQEVPTLPSFPEDVVENNSQDNATGIVTLPRLGLVQGDSQPQGATAAAVDFDFASLMSVVQPCTGSCAKFQEDVLIQLQGIRDCQAAQTGLLNAIIGMLAENRDEQNESYTFPSNAFPVKTVADLEELEKLLTEDANARNALCSLMVSRGGGNVEEAVKLILRFVMTDDVSSAHCYKGQSEKKAFIEYVTVLECILEALKRNAHTRGNATLPLLQAGVTRALKRASDRVHQRKLRNGQGRANAQVDGEEEEHGDQ